MIYKPSMVGTITSNEINTCPQRIVEYSIPSLPAYADAVLWTVPSVATILSGQGTTLIRVSYPANINLSSLVSATGINNCSVGFTRYLRVSLVAVTCPVVTPSGKDIPFTQNEIKHQEKNIVVTVYPNPSTAHFNVKAIAPENEKINLMIYDIQGREVKRVLINSGELIRIGDEFKSGVYFLKAIQKGVSVSEKIIIL